MQRIRRSLNNQSVTTLVHALVSTHVDYCNSVLAAAPKTTTDKLQCVLNAAAVSSAIIVSSTAVSHRYYMTIYIDWTFLTMSHSSWSSLFVSVWTAVHRTICRTMSSQSALLCHGSVCSTEHTGGPTLQTDHVRPSSIFCCRSHSVEQSSCCIQKPTISDACFRRHSKTILFTQQRRLHSV